MVAKKTKTDNHDLGFMIEPAFKKELDRSGSEKAKDVIITAARSLATRYDAKLAVLEVGMIFMALYHVHMRRISLLSSITCVT